MNLRSFHDPIKSWRFCIPSRHLSHCKRSGGRVLLFCHKSCKGISEEDHFSIALPIVGSFYISSGSGEIFSW